MLGMRLYRQEMYCSFHHPVQLFRACFISPSLRINGFFFCLLFFFFAHNRVLRIVALMCVVALGLRGQSHSFYSRLCISYHTEAKDQHFHVLCECKQGRPGNKDISPKNLQFQCFSGTQHAPRPLVAKQPAGYFFLLFSCKQSLPKTKESCLTLDFPRIFPSLSVTAMPSMSSVCLIKGILIQLAAATAVKGTHLFTMGGALCVSGQDASGVYTSSLDNIL